MKRLLALASSIPLILGSALLFAAPANSTPTDEDLAGSGDPIYGDGSPSSEKAARGAAPARAHAGFTNVTTWAPAITTGAATAAFIDEKSGTVYQASRSASPARLFANSMADGSSKAVTELPDTTGSWDMVISGDLLVVGTNGNGVSRPRLVTYKLDKNGVQNKTLWNKTLPVSTSVSAYVMAVVADASDPELFWVGTYDPNGARLYSFHASTGNFVDYTPGTQWSEGGLKYVRALTSTPQGLFIGMGNPGYIWRLGAGQSRPVQFRDALGGVEVSTVYSLASTSPSGGGQTGIAELLDQGEIGDPTEDETSGAEHSEVAAQSAQVTLEEQQSGQVLLDRTDEADETQAETEQQVAEELQAQQLALDDASVEQLALAVQQPTLIVAGTDSPASIQVFTEDGKIWASHTFKVQNTVVDRIAVDEARMAWFTVRPSGDLYSLDLNDPSTAPVLRSQTVSGSETRAISVKDGIVRGVTGMRQLWSFDTALAEITQVVLDRGGVSEAPDTASQGVLAGPGYTLVGGHWRFQAHTLADSFDIGVPGEPKAHVLVGDTVYTAIYPHASVFSVDVENQVATFVARAEGQTRPRSLTWSDQTKRLYMGTSNSYGNYGGALSVIDPQTGDSQTYDTPVKDQMPTALAPIGTDLLVGTSPAGEAVGAPAGSRSALVRWNPAIPDKPAWSASMPTGRAVVGVAAIRDGAGEFVFAVTADGGAFALDGKTGTLLWQETLPAGVTDMRAVGNYVLILRGSDVVEYFPSRSALTQGLTLASGIRWIDFQSESDSRLAVATVTTGSQSAMRGFVSNPRRVGRDQGANRYTTAIAISESTFEKSTYAVLATGSDFPDALTAGPLAALRDAPVLLNSGSAVRADVNAELKRLGTKTVYIAGGPGVVPQGVEASLRASGYTVKRLWGSDRYQTALAIAEEIRSVSGTEKIPMVLTTGLLFPDALSATPAVARMGGAIILTRDSSVDSRTSQYVRARASSVATVGGAAQTAASQVGVTPQWTASGKDRFETSALVAQRVFPSASSAFVATGFDYPDGLAAGPAAAQSASPVILSRSDILPSPVMGAISKTNEVTLVGGIGVLKPGLATKVRELN